MPTLPQLPPFSLFGLSCTNLLCPIFLRAAGGLLPRNLVCDSWKRAPSLRENAICPNSATRPSVLRQRGAYLSYLYHARKKGGHSLAPLCRTIPSLSPSALIFLLSLSVPTRRNHFILLFHIILVLCISSFTVLALVSGKIFNIPFRWVPINLSVSLPRRPLRLCLPLTTTSCVLFALASCFLFISMVMSGVFIQRSS